MPLYTYVVTYNNSNYIGQGSHSNFNGFINDWVRDMPINALNGFNVNLKKELQRLAYEGVFESVPNRKYVWEKRLELNNEPFVVYAIETKN